MNTRIPISWLNNAIFFVFLFPTVAFSYSDQITTERILRENKRFLEFINVCLTNFSEVKRDDFRKVYEKHFNADVAYLQSDYRRAYKQVYASQGGMEKLYRDMAKDFYLEDSKTILDRLAPGIIRSKNARAKLYLTLGYRDRTVGWTHYTTADSSNPKLYSYKLYKYEDAIKMTRRAKRYAFLALFESQSMETKKKVYNQLCKSERALNNPFFGRFVDLKEEDFIKEMGKSFDGNSEEPKKGDDAKKDDQARKEQGRTPEGTGVETVIEKKVEKSVRFRNETKAARYLINGEFEKSDDIMRKYIDDFNFKLINATFDVLSATAGAAASSEKIGYDKFKVHLMDNYSRITKKSLIEGVIDTLKVEDYLVEKEKDKSTKEEQTRDAGGREAKKATPEKKDEKAAKEQGKDSVTEKNESRDEKK